MKRPSRNTLLFVLLGAAVLLGATQLLRDGDKPEELTLTEFRAAIDDGDVQTATIKDRSHEVKGELANGDEYKVAYPEQFADELATELGEADPAIKLEVDQQQDSMWTSLLMSLLPTLLIVGLFLLVINSMQGGGSRVMQFGKAKARQVSKDDPSVTFADVAGCDEAVEELVEIKEFLQNPARFQAIGAKIPKGVLLYGPPGTGKTLLARAVAGEAGVPFFSISGSDFVEMFVGVGASRVRDLFEQAKAAAPSIIFVDEIDAVGRHRGAGLGGGHDEREQTLNQMLVEMDGFDTRSGVILIAASNRPDILDPALLRPGRFDRQIVVDRPDLEGRKAILEVHAKGKPLEPNVRLDVLARRTPGFTGADLANLMNEAALLAARRNLQLVGHAELEAAIDRVMAGPERKSRLMSEQEKRIIAYHEGGHALVGHVLPGTDPIHKISIVARGRALGWTLSLPTEDKYLRTRTELEDSMAMFLGGRTAEELVFGEITTGASDDIERCTDTARGMVTQYGMSDLLGPQQLGKIKGEVFLGRDFGHEADYSPEVAAVVDSEVRKLIDNAHERARAILSAHRATLDALAALLIEKETLEDADLAEVFGPLDKGTGITAPEPKPTEERLPLAPELVPAGAVVASTDRTVERAPAPAPEPLPAARRWWRRLGVRAPRPSGT
ncbi:MAG: ATP-dependent zinc metalloprotease FtsH [Acidimicrobiales bacterium]|nr:ATP-dependent zinc metalloprotease FtsH [Acidimicrobiales bacterium]